MQENGYTFLLDGTLSLAFGEHKMRKGSTRLFSERLQTFYKPMLSLLFFQCFCCLSSDPSRAGAIRTRTLERWPVLSNTATQWLPLSVMGHRGSSTPLLKMTAPRCKCNGHNGKRIFSQEGIPPSKRVLEHFLSVWSSRRPQSCKPFCPYVHTSMQRGATIQLMGLHVTLVSQTNH